MAYLYENEKFLNNVHKNPALAIVEVINEARAIKDKSIKNQDFKELEALLLNGSLPLILSILNSFKKELRIDVDINTIEFKLNSIENLFDKIYHKIYPLTIKSRVASKQKEFENIFAKNLK